MENVNLLKSFEFKEVHSDELRKFVCWGSVETIDRQGEIIPMEEIYKTMDMWMDRNAPIMLNHTSYQVGKGLNWTKSEKDGKPGVLITGVIFKHYMKDDEVWDGIKSGKFEGLSIGGEAYEREPTDNGTIIRKIITAEFSIVDRCANQEATFEEISMAKSLDTNNTMEYKKMENDIKKQDEPAPMSAEVLFSQLASQVESLSQRLADVEETISGVTVKQEEVEPEKMDEPAQSEDEVKPEDESTEDEEKPKAEVEKQEDEEESSEKEDEPKEDEEKLEMKKQINELKKQLEQKTVVKVVKTERPDNAKVVENTINKSIAQQIATGELKMDYNEIRDKLNESKKSKIQII